MQEKTELANGTISRHFTDLGVIWNYARGSEKYTYENPFAKHRIKVKKHRITVCSEDLSHKRENWNDKNVSVLWGTICNPFTSGD